MEKSVKKPVQSVIEWVKPESNQASNLGLLNLSWGQHFSFHGVVQLGIVKGAVNVMGYTLVADESPLLWLPCYSSSGHGFVSVAATRPMDHESKSLDKQHLNTEQRFKKMDEKERSTIMELLARHDMSSDCILVIKQMDGMGRVEEFSPTIKHMFIPTTLDLPGFSLVSDPRVSFQEPSSWQQASAQVLEHPFRVCVAGHKGFGKSTFCRYLVNRTLSRYFFIM